MRASRLCVPPLLRFLTLAGLLLAPAGLATGAPAEEQAASGSRPLPGYEIIRLGRGHYNRMDFVATIDGVKGLLFVDTGAAHTILNAAKYGFLLKNGAPRPPNLPAKAPINEMSAPIAMATDVQLGSVHLGKVPFPLLPGRYLYDQLYRGAEDRQYDGVLGEDILRHYNALVDCGRLALYLNTDPSRKINPGQALIAGGWTQIPMANLSMDFTVPCTLGSHLYRLIADTGSPYTVFQTKTLYKEHIEQIEMPMKGSVIGYVPQAQYLVRSNTLQIGGYTAVNVHPISNPEIGRALSIVKPAAGDTELVGLLGGDVLGNNGAMIDIGNHALYLRPSGGGTVGAPQ